MLAYLEKLFVRHLEVAIAQAVEEAFRRAGLVFTDKEKLT
jgi:hypothetical protein